MKKNSNDWFIKSITFASLVFMALLFVIGTIGEICAIVEDRNPKTGIDPQTALTEYVEKVSEINGVRPEVVMAIIDRESNFRPYEKNAYSGCIGLMQLSPDTVEWLRQHTGCHYDPYNPLQSIAGGIQLLHWLLDRYDGDEPMALLAYAEGYRGAERLVSEEGVNPIKTWQVQTIYNRIETKGAK